MWETVKAINYRGKASIGVGFGKIQINDRACKMISENYQDYKWAKLYMNEDKSLLAIKILKEHEEEAIKISRRKNVSGIEIQSKAHTETIFGETGIQKKVTRYEVAKKENEDMLIIIIKKEGE